MSGNAFKVGSKEVRTPIGECPWCGLDRATLRDYLCYHTVNPCCHEIFRAIPGKASLALREFSGGKVNSDKDFERFVALFHKNFKEDKRLYPRFEPTIDKIATFQVECDGKLADFFQFLIRLYIARGYIEMKGSFMEAMGKQCMVCAKDLAQGSRHELCSSCLEVVGQPEGDFGADAPPPEEAPKQSHGMYSARRR